MINNNENRVKAKNTESRMETVYIKDIQVGMKNLTLTCIVLEVGQPVALKENREVRTVKVADTTACINLAVWDDTGHYINASDILRLTKVYAAVWRNSLTLYTSKIGTIEKIGEFCLLFNDQLNMSDIAQTPPATTTIPPNGNPLPANINLPLYGRSHASATATLHAGGVGTPRYDLARNSGSRNGQHNSEDSSTINSNRGGRSERR